MEDENYNPDTEMPPMGAFGRWLPAVVVCSAVVGFGALAWYAYHAGAQSVSEDDVIVIEADKTPVKDKPLDPGGMRFPNQDKTVFETFSGNAQNQSKTEKVTAAPEEPITSQTDADGTTTSWVNKDIQAPAPASQPGAPEEVIGDETKTPAVKDLSKQDDEAAVEKPATSDSAQGKALKLDNSITSYNKTAAAMPPVAETIPPAEVEAPPAPAPKTVVTPKLASADGVKAQLGAYRSQAEAQAAWDNLQKKFASLKNKTPAIVKADLGEKGVYYRLRVTGFASTAEAKNLCSSLIAKGQACLLPVSN